MDKERLAKKLKTAKFQRKYINTPCLLISVIFVAFSFSTSNFELLIMWLMLLCINILAFLLNNHLISLLQKTEMIYSEMDRKERINQLYGKSK